MNRTNGGKCSTVREDNSVEYRSLVTFTLSLVICRLIRYSFFNHDSWYERVPWDSPPPLCLNLPLVQTTHIPCTQTRLSPTQLWMRYWPIFSYDEQRFRYRSTGNTTHCQVLHESWWHSATTRNILLHQKFSHLSSVAIQLDTFREYIKIANPHW